MAFAMGLAFLVEALAVSLEVLASVVAASADLLLFDALLSFTVLSLLPESFDLSSDENEKLLSSSSDTVLILFLGLICPANKNPAQREDNSKSVI